MFRTVVKTCKEEKLILPGDVVLVGLSGGADSVSLLLLLKELQKEIATYTKEMQEIRKAKVNLDPQQVISKVRTLAAIASVNPFVLNEFVDLVQDSTKENKKIWNEKVNRLLTCKQYN